MQNNNDYSTSWSSGNTQINKKNYQMLELFPTPVYVADIKHPTLNQNLEKDIIAWSKEDKGIKRTNLKGRT